MLCTQFANANFPFVHIDDNVEKAVMLLKNNHQEQLPVVGADDSFAGLLTQASLKDADKNAPLSTLEGHFLKTSVLPEDHIVTAIRLASHAALSQVPVVGSDKELIGLISESSLLKAVSQLIGLNEAPGGLITLEMDKRDFSFGELSRLIETNDAGIMQLNTYTEEGTGLFIVNVRVNTAEISAIVSTLQRYDYRVRYYFGRETYENPLKENYESLMNYLDI